MNRYFARIIVVATLTGGMMIQSSSTVMAVATPSQSIGESEGRWRGFCQGWWLGENLTPAIWSANSARGEHMMQRLTNCIFNRYAPGQVATALYVANRESGFYPWAQNPSSLCSGIFQHIISAWDSRAHSYLWRGWFSPGVWLPAWSDPRANIIIAARMVAAGGWGPWGM